VPPRLKHVVLTTGFAKSVITLPWGQLTRLEAQFLYLGECAEILRDATKLVQCSLISVEQSIPILIPTIPIQPHLRHLVLRPSDYHNNYGHSSFNLSGLFHNLALPALLTLRVYEPGITLGSLGEFLSRSRCTLQELRVEILANVAEHLPRSVAIRHDHNNIYWSHKPLPCGKAVARK
jgi:hypothetical protein